MWKAAQELLLNWFLENEVELPQRDHILRKKVKSSVVSDSLRPHGLQSIRLLRPQDFCRLWLNLFYLLNHLQGAASSSHASLHCFHSCFKSMEKNETSFPFCTRPPTLVLTLLSQPDISFWPHQKDKTTQVKTNGALRKSHRNDITYPCFTGEGGFLQKNQVSGVFHLD